MDFTSRVDDLQQQFSRCGARNERLSSFAYTDVVHVKTARYFRTKEAALAEVEETNACQDNALSIGELAAVGPWRMQWWRRFPDGYRIDIEEKMKWQGRCGGRWSDCYPSLLSSNSQRLRQLLDRHNVTLAEWLIFACIDDTITRYPAALPRAAAERAEQKLGVSVSVDECRRGMEASLAYGWLRIVDESAAKQIWSLLEQDRAMMPLYDGGLVLGEVDFTGTGAMLYQMIAGECYGPDWDAKINVNVDYYREEDRYCETEDGIQAALKRYADFGEIVTRANVAPIGPWCVNWWKRLPAGYLLQVEIGTKQNA